MALRAMCVSITEYLHLATPSSAFSISVYNISPMAVMLEGLGFNLCVVPFLNVCVPNLPQGQG